MARGLGLRAIAPLHVAAYIRTHPGSAPTVKQHLAVIRVLCDWFVVHQVGMRRQDYFLQGTRGWLRLHEKVVLAMIKRRASAAGLPASTCCHTFQGDGHHGVSVERGDARARATDCRPRVAQDDEAVRPDGGHSYTSTAIVFNYLDRPDLHVPADVVSNNHFDEDGLVGIYALLEPEAAASRRDLLIDVAQAGDFGVFRSRRAARIAFAISAHADPATSPFPRPLFDRPAPQVEEGLYRALLDVLPRLLAECR